ncbi:MAG: DNA primase, partial [Microbacterium sp. 69-10]|uniref:bifunctional DNA primase/polymerase n=1 Tax=Microbacterium sp. 69-10 TaxID=1895783 RepID=UPI000967E39F
MGVADVFKEVRGLSLPEAAARFTAARVPIFPCVPGEKRPLVEHGFRDASLNPAQITAWWQRWPGANIGMPTGLLSGVDVIDVDRKPGGDGFTGFQRLQDAGLIPGWSAMVMTPSGGMHAYFPAPRFEPQRSWQAANAHIDFRGEGGYVVVPPSVVTQPDGAARPYLLISGSDTAPRRVNAGAIRQLLDPREPAKYRPRPGGLRSQDAERLAGWVAALGEGERNRGLFWAA